MKDVLIIGNRLESGQMYHFHPLNVVGASTLEDKGYGAVDVWVGGILQSVKLTDLEVIEYDET